MKTDKGEDLPEHVVDAAFAQGRCPRCGEGATDLRSSSLSGKTLDEQRRCYLNGPVWAGFKCNKGAREKLATWK